MSARKPPAVGFVILMFWILTRIAGAQHTDLEACNGGGTSSGNAAGAAHDAGVCIPTAGSPPPCPLP